MTGSSARQWLQPYDMNSTTIGPVASSTIDENVVPDTVAIESVVVCASCIVASPARAAVRS
jgi:hypothetical protein